MYVVGTYVHVSLPMSYVEHLRIMVLEKIPRATETFGKTWGTEYSVSGKLKSGNRINSLVKPEGSLNLVTTSKSSIITST